MRLRIRTLFLTVALLCSMTSTASACFYVPILDPFYWLFGGCGGYNGGGYNGSGYGGGYGYGPNPHGVSRCIDDWLGYGYLRNQEGTLGHYPGRPVGCYQPSFPHLLNPCSWFASCPLFAPCGPSYGMIAPMVAPSAPPMHAPYQPQWQSPIPGMMSPYGGNCNDPCASPCMPQPMVQCQPAPVPVTTWRPVTVDRGAWRTVWVPRPVTTMVPQTQYMSAPAMMGAPMMDSGCGGDCGGVGGMGSMMPGTEMMQGAGYPDMNSGSGCCGSDNGLPQSEFQSGTPAVPQSTMLMPPGAASMSQASMGQLHSIAPYTSMSRWYANPGYSNPGYAHAAHSAWAPSMMNSPPGYPMAWNSMNSRQSMFARPAYGSAMYRQPRSASFGFNTAMMPTRQASGWQMQSTSPAQMRTAPMITQMMPPQFPAMPSQRAMSPLIGGTMPGTVYGRPTVAGDIHGDHESAGQYSAAAVPVAPNSFNGRPPIRQAVWSQPTRTASARRYPNSVQ